MLNEVVPSLAANWEEILGPWFRGTDRLDLGWMEEPARRTQLSDWLEALVE